MKRPQGLSGRGEVSCVHRRRVGQRREQQASKDESAEPLHLHVTAKALGGERS